MKRVVALVVLVLAAAAVQGAPWVAYTKPAEAGYDADALSRVRAFADERQSAAVFVVAHGRVLVAWGAVDRKLELHSVRKSVYAALWGIADARRLVDLDSTLAELDVDDRPPLTADEKKARLVDLLHARSGVYHASAYAPSSQEEQRPPRGSHAPGTFWFYNNWDFNVAGALLQEVAGQPLGVLMEDWVAKPLGMEDYTPEDVFAVREPGASRWPALTIRMSARDLARVGELWLNRGRWHGRQIIPAAWVDRASTAVSTTGTPGGGYGMMWWTYEPEPSVAAKYPAASRVRIVMGRGTGGQCVAIVPEAHLVIVHRADTDNGRSVGGPDVWKIIDGILAARTGKRVRKPALGPVDVIAFKNQLPPYEWPHPVALEAVQLERLTGDFEFQPGQVGRVYLDGGHLFAFIARLGEAELFPLSDTEFFLRVDPSARVRFETDESGRPRKVRLSMRGREMVGVRK